MASPFPGMDPFLEGAKWPDVHHKLASVISELLTPTIAPRYIVSVETYTINDTSPSSELTSTKVRIPIIEIRDQENNILITTIEILSPVNKRNPGLEPYRDKRRQLYDADVHLLEIDLLCRGTRPFTHPRIPTNHYYITLVRAKSKTKIWGFNIQDKIPVVPIPLKEPDADVVLDLGKALTLVYERSYYHTSIDYSKTPPPPPFSEEDSAWIREVLQGK